MQIELDHRPATDETVLHHVERTALEGGLREAQARTVAELEAVRDLLRRAVSSVTAQDRTGIEPIAAEAAALARRHADVHERLLALIALQAPVAGDLRLAIALLHVNDRVERMGAQCRNIAKLARALPTGRRPSARQLDCVAKMACVCDEQLAEAARVLAEHDAEGAARLRDMDAAINGHNRDCFTIAVADGDDEARREAGFLVAMVARALERIGDNAVDVGRQTAFAVTGTLQTA